MKHFFLIVIALFSVSCKKEIEQKELAQLGGYWEIEKVIMPDKSEKNYKINTTYDYIEIKNNEGFRKKVYPKLMGKFQASEDTETFKIVKNAENWQFNYENDAVKWSEILLSISENSFSVKNEAGIEYFYKRVQEEF